MWGRGRLEVEREGTSYKRLLSESTPHLPALRAPHKCPRHSSQLTDLTGSQAHSHSRPIRESPGGALRSRRSPKLWQSLHKRYIYNKESALQLGERNCDSYSYSSTSSLAAGGAGKPRTHKHGKKREACG